MCVCGTYNGNAAILTCGHGIAQNESFSRLGLNLGSVVIQRCNDNLLAYNTQDTSSYGDFSIITINTGNFTTTNKVLTSINSTASIIGVYSFPPVGTDVCKYGNSTQLVYGKIASHYNYGTFTMVQGNSAHDYYLNGMTKISLLGGGVNGVLTNNGDSGGPVFVQNPSSSGKCICGSISAGSPSGTECYYSPVTYPAAIGFVTKTN